MVPGCYQYEVTVGVPIQLCKCGGRAKELCKSVIRTTSLADKGIVEGGELRMVLKFKFLKPLKELKRKIMGKGSCGEGIFILCFSLEVLDEDRTVPCGCFICTTRNSSYTFGPGCFTCVTRDIS